MLTFARLIVFLSALLSIACQAPEQAATAQPDATTPGRTTFARAPGGPISTGLGYGIVLNSQSTLSREWISATDNTLPVSFDSVVGIRTVYKPGGNYSSGSYQYTAAIPITATDTISAIEIRFLAFDIWGELIRSLSDTEVEDILPGKHVFEPSWNVFSENEASEYYASIAYIARVRTRAGRVLEGDRDAIVTEARKFSKGFTPADLDPKPRTPGGSGGG